MPTVGAAYRKKGKYDSGKGDGAGQDGQGMEGLYAKTETRDGKKKKANEDNTEANETVEIWVAHRDPPANKNLHPIIYLEEEVLLPVKRKKKVKSGRLEFPQRRIHT